MPSRLPRVIDVTGAGDSAASSVLTALISGADMDQAVTVANTAGGLSVSQDRCVTVPRDELLNELLLHPEPQVAWETVKDVTEAAFRVEVLRRQQPTAKIVMVNGCFDLLHVGHIAMIRFAAQQGDHLFVVINDDAAVKQLKGPSRPLISHTERREALLGIKGVTAVIITPALNMVPVLQQLKPDVVVKGPDYTLDGINQQERQVLQSYGASILFSPPLYQSHSSSIIQSILTASSSSAAEASQ